MTIESDLYDRLVAQVTAVSSRVYANRLSQRTVLPALVYQRISAVRTSSMSVDNTIVEALFQIDIYSETYDTAVSGSRAVFESVRAALQRWRKTSGTEVLDTFVESDRDLFEPDMEDKGNQAGVHRVIAEFMIQYRES